MEADLLLAAAEGNLEGVKRLLQAGADPSCSDPDGISPLMKAAEAGSESVVRLLLEAGAPWNTQDKEGHCAGEYAVGKRAVMEQILDWAVCTEMLLHASDRSSGETSGSAPASSRNYLSQKLHYSEDGTKLLDADGEAVMMGWEAPLMEQHAAAICTKGGHVLNIGFGLGLVDDAIQRHFPASHTIVEAHPDVLAHMAALGWHEKPGVQVIAGRWQDVKDQLKQYDAIFFDTYGEGFEELRQFHQMLPQLLKQGGTYSFFNGFASDNFFFHMVYGRIIQLELQQLGITTRYVPLNIKALDEKVWEGVKNKYWHFETYFLPICTANLQVMEGIQEEEEEEAGEVEKEELQEEPQELEQEPAT